jgi:hypothetical protein
VRWYIAFEEHRNGKQREALNDHDKSGDIHEKMEKKLSGVMFIR